MTKLTCQTEFIVICCLDRFYLVFPVMYFKINMSPKDVSLSSLEIYQWLTGVLNLKPFTGCNCMCNVYSSLTGGRILTTTEVRLALASLAPWQQPDNTYAIHLHVLGFFGEQGGDSPQQSQPETDNMSIYIPKSVYFGKTKRYLSKSHRWVVRHFRQQRELQQGVVGKCRSRPKMICTARWESFSKCLKRKSGNESGKKKYSSSQNKNKG